MPGVEPVYRSLLPGGELARRVEAAYVRLNHCDLCPRCCGVDRYHQRGTCQTGEKARVSSYGAHMGEEDPLRGWRGSGTIFFSRCSLRCQYCQNYDISQANSGEEVEPEELAVMMLVLQARGCHNINLVTPTHVVPQILAAVLIAAQAGLYLPMVYNTGGYDALETLALLDGVIDIYMPDMKYANSAAGYRYSHIHDYPRVNRAAVREMHRQVGDLTIDEQGLARRGLLVRHLVLPAGLAGTKQVALFLTREISPDTYINIMDQYRPEFHAARFPAINRTVTETEYRRAVQIARHAGLHRFEKIQEE